MGAVDEPTLPRLAVVKSRISPESWQTRVEAARKGGAVLAAIVRRMNEGETLTDAIKREVPPSRRSWVMRNVRRYQAEGYEALIDERVPREPKVAKESGPLIEAARLAKADITVDEVVELLRKQRVRVLPSERTIRKHFARVDGRTRYAKKKSAQAGKVEDLSLAGGELLLAAELETHAVEALVDEVSALATEAQVASEGRTPERDLAFRDERGHFTSTYNRRRRRKKSERIASYLRTAEEKAEGRVPAWPRFVHESRKTLLPKVWMLTLAPLVSSTKGWDALRAPEAAELNTLTGFAYMPSTLAKFSSALAISGAGQRLLDRVGTHWHGVASSRWGEAGAMAALYVDNHAKEVWTSLFTQSGKVSKRSRVMPCITTTYVQTGAGTPLVASVQSGAAPLAPRLPALVREAEEKLESEVRRAVVIDAEGSTFDILDGFAKEGRVIVTPLRPSRAPELELSYSRGSYFRPYRDNDELRVASATLTHKSTARTLEVGALIVRRKHRESDTVLLTTGTSLGFEGRELADLYFERWPLQENFFRDGAVIGLDQHRGNCSRMVANVAVVTELDRLRARAAKAEAQQEENAQLAVKAEEEMAIAQREHQRAVDALAVRRRRLDEAMAENRTQRLARVAADHHAALTRTEGTEQRFRAAQERLKARIEKREKSNALLRDARKRAQDLEGMRTIRELDTAQDSVLTATKLTLALLISFVLREYFAKTPLSTQTFASRLFSMRGRRETTPDEERVIFYANPRDPEMNGALASACERLNKRRLTRSGRRLRYSLEERAGIDGRVS